MGNTAIKIRIRVSIRIRASIRRITGNMRRRINTLRKTGGNMRTTTVMCRRALEMATSGRRATIAADTGFRARGFYAGTRCITDMAADTLMVLATGSVKHMGFMGARAV